MRRLASVLLCLLLLPVVALADGTRFPEDTWAVVSNPNEGDCLNLREHPWQDSTSLGKYYNGTQVLLVSEYADSPDWVYVQVGQGAGSAGSSVCVASPAYCPSTCTCHAMRRCSGSICQP